MPVNGDIRIFDRGGYRQLYFADCSTPASTGLIAETAWQWAGLGNEEQVLRLAVGEEHLMLAQSDIRALLPYLQSFAATGKLVE